MKIVLALIVACISLFGVAAAVNATPEILDGHENDRDFVAYYPSGIHGVVGENFIHEGEDLIMKDDCGFKQWFFGTTSEKSGLEGELSIWKEKDGRDCDHGYTLVPDAYPEWGTYLKPGTDYCVKNIEFDANHIPH